MPTHLFYKISALIDFALRSVVAENVLLRCLAAVSPRSFSFIVLYIAHLNAARIFDALAVSSRLIA